MNWSEDSFGSLDAQTAPGEGLVLEDEGAPAPTLFAGDFGALAIETRRALIQLLDRKSVV